MNKSQDPSRFDYNSKHPLKTLYRLLDTSLWGHLYSTVLYFIKASPLYVAPLFLAEVVKVAQAPENFSENYLLYICIGYAVLLLQNVPTHMWFISIISPRIRRLEKTIRSLLISKLQKLSISYHSDAESGKLQSKVLRDVEDIVLLMTQVYNSTLPTAVSFLWILGVCFYNSMLIGTLVLITAALAAITIRVFRNKLREYNRKFRLKIESMAARVSDMIEMIPLTRAHGVQEREIMQSDRYLSDVYKEGRKLDKHNSLFTACSWVTMQLALFTVVSLTAVLVLHGQLTFDKIVLYHGLFAIVVVDVSTILNVYPQIMKGMESVRSLGEILESDELEDSNESKVRIPANGDIEFQNVSFRYESLHKHAVNGFSLNIKSGECVAFVGESGSGKSTLMNLVMGFYKPQQGSIIIDGYDVGEIDLDHWRQQLAVVMQNTILFTGSIYENLCYGLDQVNEEKVQEVIQAALLEDMLNAMPDGLDTMVGENGFKLSGGQRQRIAIARAMLRDPSVIILDEATSALDVISEHKVQEAITRLIKNKTTLIVAHRFSTIRNADKIVVMKNGRCVESGSREELTSVQGEYSRLESVQGYLN